ncbi:MAG: aromatic-ring-hydroxylating dioxygenase subunit beta [Gammaproteobacteria bacterium]
MAKVPTLHDVNFGPDPGNATAMVLWFECYQFLMHEAALLDGDCMEEWIGLLSADISYEMPIRVTCRRDEDPYAADAWHMKENLISLKMRVARLATKSAWGEDPASRTRRLIGNIRATAPDDTTINAASNIFVYYGRGDTSDYTILAAERRDVLVRSGGDLRLQRREVLLSHTTLPVQSIGIFI